MFTPTRAIAQQITPEDAGEPMGDPTPNPPAADAGEAPPTNAVPTPACRQWAVKIDTQLVGGWAGREFVMEEGWEPFAYGDSRAVLRRCIR